MTVPADSNSESLQKLLAGRRGHFQMESGYHSERWFDLDSLFDQPEKLKPFAGELGRRLASHGINAICGPVTGGATLAGIIGRELGLEFFAAERFVDPRATGLFPVHYQGPAAARERVRGRRIAIVDDAISAGSAVRGTYADLMACGARPAALGALFVFGAAAGKFAAEKALPLEAIAQIEYGLWQPADCPLCRAGVAVEIVSDAPTVR